MGGGVCSRREYTPLVSIPEVRVTPNGVEDRRDEAALGLLSQRRVDGAGEPPPLGE
jgi:hypothetical protein